MSGGNMGVAQPKKTVNQSASSAVLTLSSVPGELNQGALFNDVGSCLEKVLRCEGWSWRDYTLGQSLDSKVARVEKGMTKIDGETYVSPITVWSNDGWQRKYTLQKDESGKLEYHVEERDPSGRLLETYNTKGNEEKTSVKIYYNPINGLRSNDEAKPLYAMKRGKIDETEQNGRKCSQTTFDVYIGPDGIEHRNVCWIQFDTEDNMRRYRFADGREEQRKRDDSGGMRVTAKPVVKGGEIVRYVCRQEKGKTVFTYDDKTEKTYTFGAKNGVYTNDVITVKECTAGGEKKNDCLNREGKPANFFKRIWNAVVDFFSSRETRTLDELLKEEESYPNMSWSMRQVMRMIKPEHWKKLENRLGDRLQAKMERERKNKPQLKLEQTGKKKQAGPTETERLQGALTELKKFNELSPKKQKEQLKRVDPAKDWNWAYLLREIYAVRFGEVKTLEGEKSKDTKIIKNIENIQKDDLNKTIILTEDKQIKRLKDAWGGQGQQRADLNKTVIVTKRMGKK